MGNRLWTSRVTDYRRKGTRLAELRSLLGASGPRWRYGDCPRRAMNPMRGSATPPASVNPSTGAPFGAGWPGVLRFMATVEAQS